jgi:hypothetical protein
VFELLTFDCHVWVVAEKRRQNDIQFRSTPWGSQKRGQTSKKLTSAVCFGAEER